MIGSIALMLLGAAAPRRRARASPASSWTRPPSPARRWFPKVLRPREEVARSAATGGGTRRADAPAATRTATRHRAIPAHCRVQLVLKPSSDSLINMEMWLPPADKWNGKFMGVGNGGFAGIDSGSDERDAAGAAARLCDRGHRHRSPGAGRRVGDRSSREDDRLRLPRDARDDAQGQADRQGLLRSRTRSTPTSRAVRPAAAWR